MLNMDDALQAAGQESEIRQQRRSHPKGWEPGFTWDGDRGSITTRPLAERPKTWDAFLVDAGLDPETVEVVEPVQVRGWDTTVAKRDDEGNRYSELVRAHYYRLTVRRIGRRLDIDELVKAAKTRRTSAPGIGRGVEYDSAYVVALGDLQLGKMDGDGVEGTVTRFLDKTADAVARYKRTGRGRPVYLFHLGDCVEGFVSQGGANAWRTTLPITEQVRLYRRLALEQVKAFAPHAQRIILAGVPGNHDEANRPIHTYGDSWAIEALAGVHDALSLSTAYDHVSVITPRRDELTLTLDVCGTIVGLAHGHQFRGGWQKWWSGQSHGRHAIGEADMLIAGHFHHLSLVRESRTFLQVPALESESTWFRHETGAMSEPGIVTMNVGQGRWDSMEIL